MLVAVLCKCTVRVTQEAALILKKKKQKKKKSNKFMGLVQEFSSGGIT